MFTTLKNDVIAGFSVFLLALPLCLGIALASDFPPIAGIFSAVTGGILTSFLGGSRLSIKGPAAGLIVIVLSAVHELGSGDLQLGYERTLAVGVAAAIIQIILATMKKAVIAEVMAPSVIHGMLAAIGLIIISKQLYVMMGIVPSGSEPIELLLNLPKEVFHLNPIIFGLSLVAFAIILIWPLFKKFALIPASMIILLVIIPLSLYLNLPSEHIYNLFDKSYKLGPSCLINLPTNFYSAIKFPDFSVIFSLTSIKYIFMFALVGSIESLLTVCAVDSIAPQAAPSDLNKDLRAVGIGNLVSALIGGLPMISEIVRSKANVDYGARSARANFFHGVFMLMAVGLLPTTMNLIPLAALAALLVFVGIKLASPKEFIQAYKLGLDQFILFVVTFLVTFSIDLLVGVSVGIFLKIIMHIVKSKDMMSLFMPTIKIEKINQEIHIQIEGSLTFLSYLRLKSAIENAAKEVNNIIINLKSVTHLDHTVAMKFKTLKQEFKKVNIMIEEGSEQVSFYHPSASTEIK